MTAPSERIQNVAKKLASVSVTRYSNPHTLFDWPERADPDRLAWTDELLTLHEHPLLATLSDEAKWRLHLLEAAHFFSLNIAGEKELLLGLVERLHRGQPVVSEYLQHFVHEENAHTFVFVRFCRSYVNKIFPYPVLPQSPQKRAPGEDDFLFYARVLAFEEIADYYNVAIGRSPDVWKLSRDINAYHAEDEARHIAFGRVVVEDLWDAYSTKWDDEVRARIREHLGAYISSTLRTYVSPAVYRDAGLGVDALTLRNEVLAAPARKQTNEEATRRVTTLLRQLGALP